VACALAGGEVFADDPAKPAASAPPPDEEPQFGPGDRSFVYSLEAIQGDDAAGVHLTGWRVSAGPWIEDEFYGRAVVWGAFQQGEDQQVASAGTELALGVPFGPFRLMPRFRLGFEHRARPPDDGFAALAGIGIELNLWLGQRFQVAVSVDRDFGFPSGTRELTGIALRWAHVEKPVRLKNAAENGDTEEVRHLLESGVSMEDSTAHEALVGAAMRCDRAMLTTVLDAWRGPADNMTELSLRLAAKMCEPDVVRLLLERGADPNADYYLGGTVLMKAVDAMKTETARLLLASGADVNGRGRYEETRANPKKHHHAIVEEECRATGLMIAAGHGDAEMVALLLDAGADASFRDAHGCTAAEAARRAGHPEVAASLEGRTRP
jgi:hypothetical protein